MKRQSDLLEENMRNEIDKLKQILLIQGKHIKQLQLYIQDDIDKKNKNKNNNIFKKLKKYINNKINKSKYKFE